MTDILEIVDFKEVIRLIENIGGLVSALMQIAAQCFGWLGTGILTSIAVGATIAIILRVLGRWFYGFATYDMYKSLEHIYTNRIRYNFSRWYIPYNTYGDIHIHFIYSNSNKSSIQFLWIRRIQKWWMN